MHLLLPLAALLGIEVDAITERIRNAAIINTVIALLVLIALTFLLVAGYIALADALSPVLAALIMAGGALVLALAVYLGSRIGEGRRHREVVEKRRSSETSAFITTAAITALPVILRSPALRTLGIPAGLLAGAYFLMTRDKKPLDD